MHKLLPLFILVALGGMVVYSITRPNANFSPNKYAYDLIKPGSPLPKPSASGKPKASASPSSVRTPMPTITPACIADGNRCEVGIVCCGYCDRSYSEPICQSLEENNCIPKGQPCVVGAKHCCNSVCSNVVNGYGICPVSY